MELIEIKLEAFEGPLDLLLHLIEKNEIDIYDIPISELTDQYLKYINVYSSKDMDNLSAFLVMAATLLEIKSKMLLPKLPKFIEEENDPREELVNRLIEYKQFKKVIEVFKDGEVYAEKYFYRKPNDNIINLFKLNKEHNLDDLLKGITLEKLFAVFDETLRRRELKTDVIRSGFNSVRKDMYTVEEKIEYILDLLVLNNKIDFFDIFNNIYLKIEKVVTFLAVLELVKMKKINIQQDEIFGDIVITSKTID